MLINNFVVVFFLEKTFIETNVFLASIGTSSASRGVYTGRKYAAIEEPPDF
jgi:hypothetical protein